MSSFGQRFKQLRIERGLTQEQIAQHFHTDSSGISKYEHNKAYPNNIEEYANFFKVSVDYLLGRTDNREIKDHVQEQKESFVIELIKTMKKQGLIDDIDNISEDMQKLIVDAIKIEYKKTLKAED